MTTVSKTIILTLDDGAEMETFKMTVEEADELDMEYLNKHYEIVYTVVEDTEFNNAASVMKWAKGDW